jgi:hypothetical protein
MSEPRQLPSQPYDDGPVAFRQWIAREIARARVARADAIGAFVRQAAPAATDRAWSPIRPAARAMMGWAVSMTPRSRRI